MVRRAGPLVVPRERGRLVIYLALFALWAPSLVRARAQAFEHWHMLAPDDEEPREAGGLAICAAWCAVQMVMARRR